MPVARSNEIVAGLSVLLWEAGAGVLRVTCSVQSKYPNELSTLSCTISFRIYRAMKQASQIDTPARGPATATNGIGDCHPKPDIQ